ncbi:unnamed protein product [Cylindrotheca closterium]|uniref:PHD-type domain-containing protein n=1 Tax=Cylindrotheca closterium TaxID=2856 RepID=A0AAD2FBN5_9STRA|nr:unnamed protein product [Cylindrotheca closterium]
MTRTDERMPAEAAKAQPLGQTDNAESRNETKMNENTRIENNLKALDDLSYASSLSSTPILKLKGKSPKAKVNKSTKTPTKTSKSSKSSKSPSKKTNKGESKASDTKTKKKPSKSKKTSSSNSKNVSEQKSKPKSKKKSRPSKSADTDEPPKKNEDKVALPPNGVMQTTALKTLTKNHSENGASSRNGDNKMAKTSSSPQQQSDKNATDDALTSMMKLEPVETTNHTKKKSKSTTKSNNCDGGSTHDSEDEEEEAACCLCHCGVDCSDRALFFAKDRKKEIQDSDDDQEYYFGLDDPYLPQEMYDPHNALVYCDGCDRMYHQKCHFVPILKLPQGNWNCLICNMKTTHNKACLPIRNDPKTFFASPPNPSSTEMERKFEFDTKTEKAKLWQRQLKSVKTFLSSQVSNIRLATAALDTLTSVKRNRAMILSNRRKSQELAQTILRMTAAKFKIRQILQSLESLRVSSCTNSLDPIKVGEWCQANPKDACHVVPHGIDYFLNHRRVTPRTAEMKLDQERKKKEQQEASKDAIPSEILCSSPSEKESSSGDKNNDNNDDKDQSKESSPSKKEQSTATSKTEDDDSGITLDDLQCCICMVGDSTDDNDVLLCDGEGCYRAFHMKCIHPEIKLQDLEDEDEDWFCPLCAATANYTHGIYDALREGGDDESDDEEEKDKEEDEDGWDTPHDVFPNSKWEYETAVKFSRGKQNDDTNELLALYLGDDVVGTTKVATPMGSDSEDENDYSLFDEDSFAERQKRKDQDDEEDDEDDGDRSSQATWLSSSVEMNIDKAELNALSEVENSDSDESSSDSVARRRSRRLRSTTETGQAQLKIGVDFDKGNIVEGKRRRKSVDYRKLNDTLFGKLTEMQKANLDDGADYETKRNAKRKSTGENGNTTKRAKSNNSSADSSNVANSTAKQSDPPSENGSVANKSSADTENENDSDTGNNGSGSEKDSDGDEESQSENNSSSEAGSGSDDDDSDSGND